MYVLSQIIFTFTDNICVWVFIHKLSKQNNYFAVQHVFLQIKEEFCQKWGSNHSHNCGGEHAYIAYIQGVPKKADAIEFTYC